MGLNRTPQEVIADETGVKGIKVLNNETGEEETITVSGVFVAIGHHPNTGFLGGNITTDPNGYIVTTPGTSETNIQGVFACGDVQDTRYRQAITAAGSGCMALWMRRNISRAWNTTLLCCKLIDRDRTGFKQSLIMSRGD